MTTTTVDHLRLADGTPLPDAGDRGRYAAVDTAREPRLGEYVAVRDGPAERIGLYCATCGPDCCVVDVCGGPRVEVARASLLGVVLSVTQVVAAL